MWVTRLVIRKRRGRVLVWRSKSEVTGMKKGSHAPKIRSSKKVRKYGSERQADGRGLYIRFYSKENTLHCRPELRKLIPDWLDWLTCEMTPYRLHPGRILSPYLLDAFCIPETLTTSATPLLPFVDFAVSYCFSFQYMHLLYTCSCKVK